ncbi:MAG: AMP-binding protein [Candidatus Delongbacteria bacterium]|jgi:long-chain acyl-CoA synthetase|nr:AMP-binding protein [Candidatus Delongbacteria bacterium]
MISTNYLDKIALKTKSDQISYKGLFENIDRFSKLYSDKKYKKIAIYSENRVEWIYSFFSGWKNESIVVPVDFMASVDDVSYILNDCKPELIFYSNGTKDSFEKISKKLDYSVESMNLDEIVACGDCKDIELKLPNDKETTAVIIYTSGTTGSPKGVMLSFKNLIANVDGVTKNVPIFTAKKETLMLLPLHHIFPLAGTMMAPLASGGSIAMCPSMQSEDVKETLKNNEVNIIVGVPRFFELLYRGIKAKIDSSFLAKNLYRIVNLLGSKALGKIIFKKVHQGLGGHIETFVAGGAALNKEVGNFFVTIGVDVLEGFGMTEAAPMITFTRPGKIKIGSTGQALPGVTIEIRDGEVVAKGPNIMKGYYNRPEETAAVLKDGWLYSGDLGNLDKKGFLRITGRTKEIIVLSNGKNINPVELEIKLEKLTTFIKETAVLMHEEKLHAVIVPNFQGFSEKGVKDIDKYFKDEILPKFNESLSSYKKISQFTITKDEIPRTRLSKIQRFKLAEMINKPEIDRSKMKEPDSEEYHAVKKFLSSQTNMDIYPDHHIEYDLGLDSLGKIGFLSFIEQTFGVKIDEDKLFHFPSVQEIVDHIKNHKMWHKVENINWTATLKEKVNVNLPKSWFTQNFIKSLSKRMFQLYFRFKASGSKDLPEGPFIIAPNHQSYIDGLFVAACIKRKTMKNTFFYAKKKHVKNWFLNLMAKKNNVIVMDVNKDLKGSIQKMAEVLKRKKNIIIFPEGTRSKTGELGDFKKTFAILSKELDVPVVPVAINGAYNALSTGSIFPRPFTKVKVDFLEPVFPEGLTIDSIVEKVKNMISNTLKKK